MKTHVKFLSRPEIEKEDPTQTAIVVTGTRVDIEPHQVKHRILIGDWPGREEAYYFTKERGIRRGRRGGRIPGSSWQIDVKLLRLKKALKDLSGEIEYWKYY